MNTSRISRTEAVSGFYRAVIARDPEAMRAFLADDAVLHIPGTHPLSGAHRGSDAVLRFLDRSRAITDDGEHVEVLDVLEGADHVAVYCRVTATRAGRAPLDNTTVHVLRVEDGCVAAAWLHNWDGAAVDDFWS